jgi:hypothetical protein
MNNNIVEVIMFIEEEMNFEGFFDELFSSQMTDDEFERQIFAYTDMLIKEVSISLKVSFEEAKELYDDYLTKSILYG